MAKTALAEHKILFPAKWEADSLLSPPPYAESFANLVEKFIESPGDSRYASVATEVFHFSDQSTGLTKFHRLAAAAKAGGPFAALIRGFVVQSFGVPNDLLSPFALSGALSEGNKLPQKNFLQKTG